MEWKKYTVENISFSIVGVIALLMLLISFYLQSWLLFFSATLIFVIRVVNYYYLEKLGVKLVFDNKKVRRKFFVGEKGEWELFFDNRGVPIMNGDIRITFDEVVQPIDTSVEARLYKYEIMAPFSLGYGQKIKIKIPYQTNRRGLAKIRKIELHIPHFFGFSETVLEYKYMVKQEVLVYPRTIPVKNKEVYLSMKLGESPIKDSVYEDLLAPAGTREYLNTDSFNRIHWKASARKQALQTKVYDRIAEQGWHLSLNIGEAHSISSYLESLVSSAAELAYFSVKNHIPFSISINIRTAGHTPFYYIPVGLGSDHLQRVLEMLAHIDYHSSIYPYHKMLFFYERHLVNQPYFIQGGNASKDSKEFFARITKKGQQVVLLQIEKDEASLVPSQLFLDMGDIK
jgi:uncharacterized protein (DUF58 family)